MGNWNINIQGVGAHHNADYPNDANRLAEKFVEDLKRAGHTVEHAEFTHGGKQDISKVQHKWTDSAPSPATTGAAEQPGTG